MTPEHPGMIGPYQVLEPMGRGGMAVVYRAQHRQTGAMAAVKTVRFASQELLQSLRHEIRTLARLRHPGIVSILEEGLHEGLPWYAMELLEGMPLHRYWAQSTAVQASASDRSEREPATRAIRPGAKRTGGSSELLDEATRPGPGALAKRVVNPAPPRSGPRMPAAAGQLSLALRLVHRICSPLGYLHGEGLVHRDLKPGNVLVRPDGSLVLIDFGLLSMFASRMGRDALELESLGAGTAGYMAPEQIRGESCDARTDLYSLGCILYELVAGRRPFLGDDAQVMAAHLEQRPPQLGMLVEDAPVGLSELLQRLLAKEPRERLGHAADVAAALERLGVPATATGGPRPRSYLYRPNFAGRQPEMEWLREGLVRISGTTAQSRGGIYFVGGAYGIGKTRLALELAREAGLAGVEVMTGECLPPEHPGGGRALGPLRRPLQRLADRCRELGPAEGRRVFGNWVPLLAAYEPSLSTLLAPEEAEVPVQLPPDVARMRLNRALLQVVEAVVQGGEGVAPRPLLLVLDDLQWADGLTLGLLGQLLQYPPLFEDRPDAPALRLMILGLYRSEEASEELRSLIQSPNAHGLELEPLDAAEVSHLIAGMLALPQAPGSFSRFVSRQAEGNPFFVTEYLRAAVDEGPEGRLPLLWRDETGLWHVAEPGAGSERHYEELALPSSLRDLIGRRLEELPPIARVVAEAAAVAGRQVDLSLLGSIAGLPESALDDGLDELLRRQVLEQAGPNALHFTHDKLREGTYERILPERLQRLHLALAQTLEAQGGNEQRLAELGSHWEQGGLPDQARRYYLAAARQALQRYANEEAERLFRAYLRLVEEPSPESVEVLNDLGEKLLLLRGRNDEALAMHERAAAEARSLGDLDLEAESLRSVGRVHWKTSQLEQARHSYEQALALFRRIGARDKEGLVLSHLGGFYYDQGQFEVARSHCQQALDLALETQDPRLEASALGNLAVLMIDEGRLDEARPMLDRTLGLYRMLKNRSAEGNVLGNLGVLYHQSGQMHEARRIFEQELAIHREIGDRRFEAKVLGNLGDVLMDLGLLEEARQFYEQSLALHQEVGNRLYQGVVLGSMAQLDRALGRLQRVELLELARDFLESVGDQAGLGTLYCEWGHWMLADPRTADQAPRFLMQARELADRIGATSDGNLGTATAKLAAAIEAFEDGEFDRLILGELRELVAKPLLEAMERSVAARASAS